MIAASAQTKSPMQTVSLTDTALGMHAMNLTLPAGWHFQGEVVRNVGCSPGDPFATYRAESPDGSISISMLTPFFTIYPPQSVGRLNFSSCGMVMPAVPTGKLLSQYIVPAIRKGAQASAPEPIPGTEQLIRSMSSRGNMMINSGDTARVHLTYTMNGKPVEENILGITRYTQFQGMPGGSSQTMVFTIRAPEGQLKAFVNSVYPQIKLTNDPEWMQRSANLSAEQTRQIQQAGAATRQGIMNQTQQNIQNTVDRSNQTVQQIQNTGAVSRQVAKDKQQAIDNAAAGTAGYVGDKVVTYHWLQQSTGNKMYTQTPRAPGPGWVQIP
jgi:hypothetical protein